MCAKESECVWERGPSAPVAYVCVWERESARARRNKWPESQHSCHKTQPFNLHQKKIARARAGRNKWHESQHSNTKRNLSRIQNTRTWCIFFVLNGGWIFYYYYFMTWRMDSQKHPYNCFFLIYLFFIVNIFLFSYGWSCPKFEIRGSLTVHSPHTGTVCVCVCVCV